MVHGRGTGTYTNRDVTWGNGEVDGVCGDGMWDVGRQSMSRKTGLELIWRYT